MTVNFFLIYVELIEELSKRSEALGMQRTTGQEHFLSKVFLYIEYIYFWFVKTISVKDQVSLYALLKSNSGSRAYWA